MPPKPLYTDFLGEKVDYLKCTTNIHAKVLHLDIKAKLKGPGNIRG